MIIQKVFHNHKYKIDLNSYNTKIWDSYKVTSYQNMNAFINLLRQSVNTNYAIHKRNKFGMIIEWRSHNLLYKLNIKRNRTKDVDLNIDEKWYYKIIYFILSLFYI